MSTITKNHRISIAIIMVMLIVTPFVLAACGDDKPQITSITIEVQNGTTSVAPDSTYTIKIKGNTGEEITENYTLQITDGNEIATLNNNTLIILDSAQPDDTVTLSATYNNLTATTTLNVTAVPATSVTLNNESDEVFAGEIIELSASVLPQNSTEKVNFVASSGATVTDNRLIIDSNATTGTQITVRATAGSVESSPITFTVIEFQSENVVGINIENRTNFSNNTLTIDTARTTSARLLVSLTLLENDTFKTVFHNGITYSVADDSVLSIDNLGNITPLKNGTTQVTATFGTIDKTITVKVIMLPTTIYMPENYRDTEVEYNFAVGTEIADFVPAYFEQNGADDYALNVYSGDTLAARFETVDGETSATVQNSSITYDGNILSGTEIATYSMAFETITGSVNERETARISMAFNNGINVSTKDGLKNAINQSGTKLINIINDITISGSSENFVSYGNITINGNGFTLDASNQLFGTNQGYDNTNFFDFKPVNNTTPYSVTVRDFEVVGGFGYMSAEQIFEKIKAGDPTSTITVDDLKNGTNGVNASFFDKIYYKTAFRVDNDFYEPNGTLYAYAIPYFKNVDIRNFATGIKIYYGVDEIALGTGNHPAVEDVSIYNMFADGITFEASIINIDGVEMGMVGGSPLAMNGADRSNHAGGYRDEDTHTNDDGDIVIDNRTDGNGLYLRYQMLRDDSSNAIKAIFNAFGGSVSAIINTVISALISTINSYYPNDPETLQKISDSYTNVMQRDSEGRDLFNLFYFNATEAGTFEITDTDSIVKFDSNFCINGIDTTHKFIEIDFYTVFEQSGLLGIFNTPEILNALRPIKVIAMNYNYQA